jgi:hypothetical protein
MESLIRQETNKMGKGCSLDQTERIENTQPLPQRVKAYSVSGFALLSGGEEPCPLRLQTVF